MDELSCRREKGFWTMLTKHLGTLAIAFGLAVAASGARAEVSPAIIGAYLDTCLANPTHSKSYCATRLVNTFEVEDLENFIEAFENGDFDQDADNEGYEEDYEEDHEEEE
jgi:hypothetical protein